MAARRPIERASKTREISLTEAADINKFKRHGETQRCPLLLDTHEPRLDRGCYTSSMVTSS